MTSVDEFRSLPVFEGLEEAQLAWIARHAEVIEAEQDQQLFKEGTPADAMFIMLEGLVHLLFNVGGQLLTVVTYNRGSVLGVLPYSRMTHYSGVGVAMEPSRILRIRKEHFTEMLRVSPALGQRLVAIMSDRVREGTRLTQQREKMAALGRLSAGLAHELNNPAAAVGRAADALRERLAKLPGLVARLARHNLDADQVCAADALREQASRQAPPVLSTVERGEREDELADWLDARAVAEGWLLAETFVDVGLDAGALEALGERIPPTALPDVAAWIEGGLAADRLLREITDAAGRISELVAAVKTYSHMDRAPDKQPTDVREGLDSTLTMLSHKLKKKGIRVERTYASDLPAVPAYVGELNQVWTNLIDNAVDAMEDGGTLTLTAASEGARVAIQIADDGKGIPAEIQPHIFEPFFTTKGVGEGTGLGLDVVQRVVRQHEGDIRVASSPGRTVFTVLLPLK